MNLAIRITALTVSCLVLSSPLQAQVSSLYVEVTSPTGPIRGAEIQVWFQDVVIAGGWTNDEGVADFRPVPSGTFAVEVSAFGYTSSRDEAVRVDEGARRNLSVRLGIVPIELEGIVLGPDQA
jgi:hypothetical protein